MEASKLVISPDNLRFRPLPKNKKLQLRKENVKALIRSKPAGTKISTREFQTVTSLVSSGAWRLINNMVDSGEISRVPIPGKTKVFSYSVNGDVKVTKVTLPEPVLADDKEQPDKINPNYDRKLKDIAKDFAWENGSDSLREFIQWYELTEKYNG